MKRRQQKPTPYKVIRSVQDRAVERVERCRCGGGIRGTDVMELESTRVVNKHTKLARCEDL